MATMKQLPYRCLEMVDTESFFFFRILLLSEGILNIHL